MENNNQSFIYLKGYNNIRKHQNTLFLLSFEELHNGQVKK